MAGHLPGRGFESLPESLSLSFPSFLSLYFFLSQQLWLVLRSDCEVWSMSKIWACVSHFALATPPLSHTPHQLMTFRSNVSFGEFTNSWMCSTATSCHFFFSCVWNLQLELYKYWWNLTAILYYTHIQTAGFFIRGILGNPNPQGQFSSKRFWQQYIYIYIYNNCITEHFLER